MVKYKLKDENMS